MSGSDVEHFDSTQATSDYTTEVSAIFANLNFQASEKLGFFGELMYTQSTGSFEPFDLPEPEIEAASPISPDNPNTKSDYDFSGVGDYSDLDYTQLEATFGATLAFRPGGSLYASITMMDLQDDAAYVYGDLSGMITMYAGGMKLSF